ncbi:hypothetical protein N7491_002394 [Penicillium cf. griseofulvum]|uniref:Uncharacterized protein n=1 Tax=Penicillium cf. griseofulvum TaxID=2972120 RepID=A0A9W9T363_9EURO|nr:hypothetical protein N7472_003423 [Penicillium cf. griseofulvum]KAJ5446312.1 hypothetical protein N7491_002394 [Penicillium cf. griseofulvum]KAJ5448055.1 hypothetical protein N7445_002876 [Penicillium cf. griseofulvum]
MSTAWKERQTSHTRCQSRFKTVTLGTTDTARLLGDCIANTTTLTGIIQVVLVASLFANLTLVFSALRTAGQVSPTGTMENLIATPCPRFITTYNRAQGWNTASVWNEARRIHTSSKVEWNRRCGIEYRKLPGPKII